MSVRAAVDWVVTLVMPPCTVCTFLPALAGAAMLLRVVAVVDFLAVVVVTFAAALLDVVAAPGAAEVSVVAPVVLVVSSLLVDVVALDTFFEPPPPQAAAIRPTLAMTTANRSERARLLPRRDGEPMSFPPLCRPISLCWRGWSQPSPRPQHDSRQFATVQKCEADRVHVYRLNTFDLPCGGSLSTFPCGPQTGLRCEVDTDR